MCVYVCMDVCVYVWMYVCVYVWMCVCMYGCMCVCMDVCICVCMYDVCMYVFIYLFTAIGLLPGGSDYFTSKQNMKLVTTRFKTRGLHDNHVVATWNCGNHLSICL